MGLVFRSVQSLVRPPPAKSLGKACLSFFMCVGSGICFDRGGPTA